VFQAQSCAIRAGATAIVSLIALASTGRVMPMKNVGTSGVAAAASASSVAGAEPRGASPCSTS
jgi:hypothetical protein